MYKRNDLNSAESDVGQRCGPRRSPRSDAVEEVRPEVGLPPVTAVIGALRRVQFTFRHEAGLRNRPLMDANEHRNTGHQAPDRHSERQSAIAVTSGGPYSTEPPSALGLATACAQRPRVPVRAGIFFCQDVIAGSGKSRSHRAGRPVKVVVGGLAGPVLSVMACG
jgi:hypothetical protein